ncbi:hypothetical protein Hanom_Chr15g01347171 [Helianthus anomalus]
MIRRVVGRGVNESGRAQARVGSSSTRHVFMKLELELGLVRGYLFEPELVSRVKPKAHAQFNSARVILRTTSNELKALPELASISLKRGKAQL